MCKKAVGAQSTYLVLELLDVKAWGKVVVQACHHNGLDAGISMGTFEIVKQRPQHCIKQHKPGM
jgi:hypothetical protein